MSGANRLYGLDAMRGLAALSVVGFHAHTTFEQFPEWWGKGYLAVDLFMMLSGYVMARTYEARLISGALGAGQFFAIRYRRLWPTMALGALIGVPYLWALAGEWRTFLTSFLPNLLLVPAPLNNELIPLNGPAWSIFYELIANLVHAALLCRLSNRSLATLAAGLFACLAVFASLRGNIDVGALAQQYGPALLRALTSYVVGILLWRWWQDEPPVAVSPVVAIAALPLLMLTPFSRLGWGYDLAFVALAAPLLIAGGLRLQSAPRWAMWSGLLSFPLYAVHVPVMRAARLYGVSPGLAVVGAIVVGIAAAVLLRPRPARATAAPAT